MSKFAEFAKAAGSLIERATAAILKIVVTLACLFIVHMLAVNGAKMMEAKAAEVYYRSQLHLLQMSIVMQMGAEAGEEAKGSDVGVGL